jgi:hypothetical protein
MNSNSQHSAQCSEPRPDRQNRNGSEEGFSLIELLAVVNIIALIVSMMVPQWMEWIQKAWLARCHAELKGIQAGVYMVTLPDTVFPSSDDFWDTIFPGAKPGPYHYLVDNDDANNGHGNELDGWDEGNPGNKEPPPDYVDLCWVVVCEHNHHHLAKYCYITDYGVPQIATEEDDPGYQKFINRGGGKKPGGGTGGGKKK